ncbi:hypothetical protein IMSAGC019_03338 [Lachnospiraceae bacterium]|nr:hypothetical protein IMSAGC019_03338 [Lachnospiraceae bacterium]
MKKRMLVFRMLVAMVFMVMCRPVMVMAQGEISGDVTSLNQFMTAQERVEAKASPDDSAETIITYEVGDTIFITGETEDGWYIVLYQGKTGYIPVDVKENLQEVNLDVAALDAEMEAEIAEAKLVVEEVERYRAEAKRSRIWGVVIVLLVVAIFAVGIISTIQVKKQKEGKKNRLRKNVGFEDIADLDNEKD